MLSTPALRSIFREQVFEVVFGETLSEAFFAQYVGDGLSFALLEFPDFFFHRAWGNEAVSMDRSCLTDAVRTIDRLRFDCRIPPRVVQNYVARGR